MEINLIELFSGIGGFTKGFEEAGFKIKKHRFSEIDKNAIANYRYNYPNAEYIGSVTDVRGKRGQADVITFGSPCQDFSLAGKREGMDGQRSSLILEAIRLISQIQPSVFVWENVKGTFSSNDGADFWAILNTFTNIGNYRLEWQLLNTSWFLPQNRERIYLIGHLAGKSIGNVFPITETNKGTFEGKPKTPIVRAITAGGNSGGHHSGMTLISHNGHIDKDFKEHKICPTLKAESHGHIPMVTNLQGNEIINTIRSGGRGSLTQKHNWDIVKIAKVSRTEESKKIRKESMSKGRDYSPFQGKQIEFVESDIMNTITCAVQKDNLIKTTGIRRLTEIEVERFQGFPDNWTKYGNYDGEIKKISKTQRYKMCGNAVTVNVVKEIAKKIKLKP